MFTATDFTWSQYWWETRIELADGRLAAGPVALVYAPEGRGDGELTSEELGLLDVAGESMTQTIHTAVEGLYRAYPQMQASYDYTADEAAMFMPNLVGLDELYELVEVSSVNVPCVSRDGLPYVGVAFSCPWDPEHGAGVLVHGSRVVEVGNVDTAFLLWIVEQDASKGRIDRVGADEADAVFVQRKSTPVGPLLHVLVAGRSALCGVPLDTLNAGLAAEFMALSSGEKCSACLELAGLTD